MKKLLRFIPLLLITVFVFSACSASPKAFETDELSIVLTDDFVRDDSVNETQDAVFVSNNAIVCVLSESFNQLGVDDSFTGDDYAEIVLATNQLNSAVMHKDQFTYFIFEVTIDGDDYKYLAVVLKGDDAFYMLQFASLSSEFESMLEDFWVYADSVELK